MHCGSHRLFISSILAFALHFVDGCGRTPARPKPTPSTLPPNERPTKKNGPPTTPPPNPYQFKCSAHEVREAACLNGGQCYALELVEVRSAHCNCFEMWTGVRCERIDEKMFVLPADKIEIAGIATGVSALVIVLAVIIAYVLILRRLRVKRRQESAQNGYVCKPFIQDGTNNAEHAPYDHRFHKSDSHCTSDTARSPGPTAITRYNRGLAVSEVGVLAIHVDQCHYDHNFHDDMDNNANGDQSYSVNSETKV